MNSFIILDLMTSNNNLMEKGLFFRRVFHLLFALVIIYYLFPKTLFGIPMYIYFIILFFILPLLIETIRLKKGLLFPGLHEHERNHVASYLWFSFGATILILFFPQQIAAPCIVATALGDPVIGMTKPYRRRFMVSIAIFAAGVTFIAESFEFKIRVRLRPNLFWSRSKKKLSGIQSFFDFLFRTDDDFIMQIIPAVVLYLLFLILPNLAPPQLLHPLPQLLPFT
jgi:hypothetical protein